jgi:hypothetical protein
MPVRIAKVLPIQGIFVVHFLCSPKENEPKERAPCHSVLRTFLCFSKGPALEKTRFAQTVHERNPDLSAMLDLVTTGLKEDFGASLVITCPVGGCFLRPPADGGGKLPTSPVLD